MLKRQKRNATLCDPVLREAGIQLLAKTSPEEPAEMWDLLRTVLTEGLQSIDQRLQASGPLQPERFDLAETNQRLTALPQHGRLQR